MDKKNLMSQMVKPVNSINVQSFPAELIELSQEDLQQVVGGSSDDCKLKIIERKDGTRIIKYVCTGG